MAPRSIDFIEEMPRLPTGKLYKRLLEFKQGTRHATIMHQHAKGYTDTELQRIVQIFAAWPVR